MITLYSGTPGSGKSLHAARKIVKILTDFKLNVIANFPIDMDVVTKNGKKRSGNFTYKTNIDLTVKFLKEYAKENHNLRKESQTLIVIDEAGVMFNPRDYQSFDRPSWLRFMSQHRKLGYNIILISQFDRQIDRQIRACIEYEIKHRKANNFGFIGLILSLFRLPIFVGVTKWYGTGDRLGAEWFFYRKKDELIYDTFMLFDEQPEDPETAKDKQISSPTPLRTHRGGAGASRRGPGAPGAEEVSQVKVWHICNETECSACRHERYCKMEWKYKQMRERV